MDDQGRPSYLAVVSPFPSTWSKSHHLKNNRVGMAAGQLGQEVLHGDEHEGIQFWKSYFEFSYYLLVCPFRFEWDCKRRTYHCHTNKVQTVRFHFAKLFTKGKHAITLNIYLNL